MQKTTFDMPENCLHLPKMSKFDRQQNYLHPDILMEVLTRLPIRKVFQLTCVSTLWRSVIMNPYFYELYLSRNPNALVISVSDDNNDTSHNFYYSILKNNCNDDDNDAVPREFVNSLNVKDVLRRTQIVDGMVCVRYKDTNNLRCLSLVSVRSGETMIELPYPGHRLAYYHLGFEPVSGVYKLLTIGKPIEYFFVDYINSNCFDCHIITLSGEINDMCWRKVPKSRDPVVFGARSMEYLETQSNSVNGSLFWPLVVDERLPYTYRRYLFSFDLTEEKFRRITPPKDYPNIILDMLTQFRGRLALFSSKKVIPQPGLISLYTLDDKDGFAWTKHIITLPCEVTRELREKTYRRLFPVGSLPTGELLIALFGRDDPFTPIYSYDYRNNLFERITVVKLPKCAKIDLIRFTVDDGYRCI